MRGRIVWWIAEALTVLALAVAPAAQAAGHPASPAQVVRAWSAAIARDDNRAAADLFAPNAVVTQNGLALVLFSHPIAVLWNSGLPCRGRIVKLTVRGNVADATFVLGDRRSSKCDAPGSRARAAFVVRRGQIVRWTQLPVATRPPVIA